jgi:nicotinamide-nucleotide amidase
MNVAVISIGHELLMGKTTNHHLVTLGKALKGIGLEINHALIIKDDPDTIKDHLKDISDDILIFTGGLGPTPDDLTKETVCDFFNIPLELHEPSLENIKNTFKRYGKSMAKSNIKQALFPKDTFVIQNEHGTAPGAIFKTPTNQTIVLLPGPPVELNPMIKDVKAYFQEMYHQTVYEDGFLVGGIGESEMEDVLEGLYASHKEVYIAPYAGNASIQYFFTSSNKEALDAAKEAFYERAKAYIVGPYKTTYESLLVDALRKRLQTVSVAESITSGLVASMLGSVAGVSDVFKEGYITYSNESKTTLLGVSGQLMNQHNVVSEEVVIAMAKGLYEKTKADLCAAITGYAGPTQEKDIPVGTVYMAVYYLGNITTKNVEISGDRNFVRSRSAAQLLYLMLKAVI